MRLIIVRHARAKDRDAKSWPDDTQRPLTKGGRRDFARLAARVPSWIEPPAAVLSSGWVRAWDTAAILCNETGWPDPIRCRALETEGGQAAVQAILQELRARADQASVAMVGHEPVLGELIGHLLGGDALHLVLKTLKTADRSREGRQPVDVVHDVAHRVQHLGEGDAGLGKHTKIHLLGEINRRHDKPG
jgi:phosphohistidine phosphatase SixA